MPAALEETKLAKPSGAVVSPLVWRAARGFEHDYTFAPPSSRAPTPAGSNGTEGCASPAATTPPASRRSNERISAESSACHRSRYALLPTSAARLGGDGNAAVEAGEVRRREAAVA